MRACFAGTGETFRQTVGTVGEARSPDRDTPTAQGDADRAQLARHPHRRRDHRIRRTGGLHGSRPPGPAPRTGPLPGPAAAGRPAVGPVPHGRARLHEPRRRHRGGPGPADRPEAAHRTRRRRAGVRRQRGPGAAGVRARGRRARAARTLGVDFLAGAASAEAQFDGFAAEADFQDYLDAYAWPGIVVFTGLQYRGGPDEEQAAGWRRFVDAAQRVDFLADLAGDLGGGRLCIPRDRLAEHGVTREDLEQARDTEGVRALLAAECGLAREALDASAGIVDLADPGLRAVGRTMRELMAHQLTQVEDAGVRALRRDIGYGLLAPLRILTQARRPTPTPTT
ncbi:squalene/phytoene synthase family protein [Streptomyces sp. 12297]